MTGWTITCDSGGNCPAYINQDTGLAEFSANTGTRDIIYTITYTDENGNCGSTTIRQPGNCSGPGPEPPQPVGACNFTKYTTSNIPSIGDTVTAITYNTELCDASSISATSTTEGVNLSVGDGIITMEVGATDSQRTIDVTVKVTIDGEEKTYDFTFIQSGSSPTPGGDNVYVNIVLNNTCNYDIKIIGKVKFMILPPAGSANGVAQVYFKQKNENLYCTDITVPANGRKTLNYDDMIYEGSYDKAGWPEGQSWPSIVGHLDEYKGGEISKNNTGGGNTDQLYVYTYLNMYPGTGTGQDNNSVIKTSLVDPQTFDGGSEGDIKTYTINISIDNQTTFWCRN